MSTLSCILQGTHAMTLTLSLFGSNPNIWTCWLYSNMKVAGNIIPMKRLRLPFHGMLELNSLRQFWLMDKEGN